MLPYGGMTRIRFIGYDLNRKTGTPAIFFCFLYFFSTSSTSYSFFQYFPVK